MTKREAEEVEVNNRFSYSMIEVCKKCGKSGPRHPVNMFSASRHYRICTPCVHGVEPAPPPRRKKVVVEDPPPPRRKKRVVG